MMPQLDRQKVKFCIRSFRRNAGIVQTNVVTDRRTDRNTITISRSACWRAINNVGKFANGNNERDCVLTAADLSWLDFWSTHSTPVRVSCNNLLTLGNVVGLTSGARDVIAPVNQSPAETVNSDI